MPPHHQLLWQLHQLAASVDADPTALADHLEELTAALRSAVTGYAGLVVTVVHTGHPVTLAAVDCERVRVAASSLRLPLPLLSPSYEAGGQALLYSTTSGALVDLAADLRYALRAAIAGPLDLALDVDLPAAVTTSGVTGLSELATIHRVTGLLIDQGHDPDAVLDLLTSLAVAAGVDLHVIAARLLP